MPYLADDISFQEKNQSFWQTGLILSSGLGLVSMMVGGQVPKNYGTGTAIISILFWDCIFLSIFILSTKYTSIFIFCIKAENMTILTNAEKRIFSIND